MVSREKFCIPPEAHLTLATEKSVIFPMSLIVSRLYSFFTHVSYSSSAVEMQEVCPVSLQLTEHEDLCPEVNAISLMP